MGFNNFALKIYTQICFDFNQSTTEIGFNRHFELPTENTGQKLYYV